MKPPREAVAAMVRTAVKQKQMPTQMMKPKMRLNPVPLQPLPRPLGATAVKELSVVLLAQWTEQLLPRGGTPLEEPGVRNRSRRICLRGRAGNTAEGAANSTRCGPKTRQLLLSRPVS